MRARIVMMPILVLVLVLVSAAAPAEVLDPARYKGLGENGGTEAEVLDALGPPDHTVEVTVTDPASFLSGIIPLPCTRTSPGDHVTVLAYREGTGHYQVLLRKGKMLCLRWNTSPDPFDGIAGGT